MRMLRAGRIGAVVVGIALLAGGCGGKKKGEGGDDGEDLGLGNPLGGGKKKGDKGKGDKPAGDKGKGDKGKGDKAAADKGKGDKGKGDKGADLTKALQGKGTDDDDDSQGGGGSGASADVAQRFTAWSPLHAFLGAPVASGAIVSASEAIVFTKDNQVGVTLDGGATWGFERMTTGSVRAVAGAPGGPFVVVGAGGFYALSADGKGWTDQPRYTNDELWAVAVGKGTIAAVGKNGSFVKTSATGEEVVSGLLPDKTKAGAVSIESSGVRVYAGKKILESKDGQSWAAVELPPVVAGPKDLATSQGLCALGKVGKRKGVVCTVAGTAYGIGSNDILVVGKAWLGLSKNGGATWAMVPLPLKGIKAVNGKAGGPYHVGDGKTVATSSDGKSWTAGEDLTVLDGRPVWTAMGKCESVPNEGESCAFTKAVTTSDTLPEVRGLRFVGEVGLAMGDSALVAMTADGGKSWKSASGYALGGVQGFDLKGDRIIAVGKTRVAVSLDAGKTFRPVELPPKTPVLLATRIADDGAVYLAGRAGTILLSDKGVTSWTKLDTGPKNKTDYLNLHEVGGVLYAAGARGELHRSPDAGRTWTPVATGLGEPIQRMTGEGDIVLALSSPPRFGGNKLLRSNDGGQHFFVQRELSDQGSVAEFKLDGGELRYANLASTDFGATWTKYTDWYWSGSVDIGDGSGVRITNVGSYSGKDRFYVIGTEKEDYTIIDSFFNKGGWLRCAESSGCWMVAGGQVYRPR
ncbi:MAG: hypothetical protein IT370_36045 [Deltaproteobacteria bacterium]|nr:hypothetical protein [Deltaproteobacteria bacterium]